MGEGYIKVKEENMKKEIDFYNSEAGSKMKDAYYKNRGRKALRKVWGRNMKMMRLPLFLQGILKKNLAQMAQIVVKGFQIK